MSDKTKDVTPKALEKLEGAELVDYLRHNGVSREQATQRVYEMGLTAEDVLWNQRLSRPLVWMETVEPEVEVARREAWTEEHVD